MKAQKGFRPPKAESWMTTDTDERKKRRERASVEAVLARGELDMQPIDGETLDLAVRGADMPNPVERVRHFVDECRPMF